MRKRDTAIHVLTISICLLLIMPIAGPTHAQAPQPAPTFNPQDVIPFDAVVRRGTLSNGLTYFIRRNARPEKRVALRLAVKAGSLFEADAVRRLLPTRSISDRVSVSVPQVGRVATCVASTPSENDFSCGFQSNRPSGTCSSTFRVVAISWSNSGISDSTIGMPYSRS